MQGIMTKGGVLARGRGLGQRGSFALKWVATLAVIIGADIIFWQKQWLGSGFGLFAGVLLLAVVAARGGIRSHVPAMVVALVGLFYAGAMAFDPSLPALLLFLVTITLLTLMPGAAKGGDGWQWFQRLFFHGIVTPFVPLLDLVRWSRIKAKLRARGRKPRSIKLPGLQTLLLPLIGSAVFILLFAAANPIIESALASLSLPGPSFETVLRAIFWLFIFCGIWSLLRAKLARRVAGTFDGRGDIALPGVTLPSLRLSLGLFNIIFAAQNLMDIAYLGGFAKLPEGMSLAEYAHRGAYPLIATALLAGLSTLITLRPGSTSARDPFIRRLLVLWIGQNIFLVASSMERTFDYIRVFSLTEWRIAALAWMLLVAVGLALICWRMLKDKNASWLINTNLLAAGVMLSIFTVVDMSAVAAQWNVRHAQEVGGEGTRLDLCYLNNMGGPALLPLIELEQRPGLAADFRQRVKVVRMDVQAGVAAMQHGYLWTIRNAQRLSAAESQVGKVSMHARMPGYECDGSKSPPPPEYPEPAPLPGQLPDQNPAQPAGPEAAKSSLPSPPPSTQSPHIRESEAHHVQR